MGHFTIKIVVSAINKVILLLRIVATCINQFSQKKPCPYFHAERTFKLKEKEGSNRVHVVDRKLGFSFLAE